MANSSAIKALNINRKIERFFLKYNELVPVPEKLEGEGKFIGVIKDTKTKEIFIPAKDILQKAGK